MLLLTSVELVVFLEVSIVNVALPTLGVAPAFTETGLAWVVNAYQRTFGGFQLVTGSGLAALEVVCALVMFTRPNSDPATTPPQPQGAHRR